MSLITGESVSLHRGTVLTIRSPGERLDGERGSVEGFKKNKWKVRLLDGDKQVLVPERCLSLGFFSVLPSSLDKTDHFVGIDDEEAQGGCGRGVRSNQAIKARQPAFEEAPIIVVSTDRADGDYAHQRYYTRFEAYTALAQLASSGNKAAIAAFQGEDHSPAGHVPADLRDAANAILEANASPDMPPEVREGSLQVIIDTLMRYEMNQVGYNRGHSNSVVQASGLYCLTSRLNHSCDANISIQAKKGFCEQNGMAYDPAVHGDMLVAVANRDIPPGTPLTINYLFGHGGFPPDWDYHQRRAKLLQRGFKCVCRRCVVEERVEEAKARAAQKQKKAAEAPTAAPAAATTTTATEEAPSVVVVDDKPSPKAKSSVAPAAIIAVVAVATVAAIYLARRR